MHACMHACIVLTSTLTLFLLYVYVCMCVCMYVWSIRLSGPIPATENALRRANLTINDIDLYEVNEAFASVPLAWQFQLKADSAKLNVNGGACALGHPLGATGAKLMTQLLWELERSGKRCERSHLYFNIFKLLININ